MKTVKTADLTGTALDWAVAKCEGMKMRAWRTYKRLNRVDFSTKWELAGPIIEREKITLDYFGDGNHENGGIWMATYFRDEPGIGVHMNTCEQDGPTPLIAAMRCYVASKLGGEVDVPEEVK